MERDSFVSHSLLPSVTGVDIKACAVFEVLALSIISLPKNPAYFSSIRDPNTEERTIWSDVQGETFGLHVQQFACLFK